MMTSLKVVLVLLIIVFFSFSNAYKILAVFPHEGKSHLWIFRPIIQALVEKGHELTVIVHYSFGVKSQNYKEILLKDPNSYGRDYFDLDITNHKIKQILCGFPLFDEGLHSCDFLLSNQEVKRLLITSKNEKFDLILAEFFNSECYQGFVQKFKVPFVGISTTTLMPWHGEIFGNPDNPSYIPDNHLWYGSKMDFWERLGNTLGMIFHELTYKSYVGENKKLIERHIGNTLPDLGKAARNASLMLVNSHFSLFGTRPLVQQLVEIGGVHIGQTQKLLTNIEKFINESTHGVIYFSLGSMIKGHTFPQEKREEFLKAFARLPQRVLWKWENETMPGKPDNVMIQKWMPQFDILSHPNVKAFISHGGLLGVTEAVHCGVPMMVMPQYGDQHTNAKAVEANGGGVILYLRDATEEKVYQNLKTILDPEFREKAKALSERFRDRPMSPMDTAIYWVEYVARHKGAPHLRTAAVDMPLYQYLLLDVFAFLAAVLLVSLYVTYKISSLIFRSIFSKKKVKQS